MNFYHRIWGYKVARYLKMMHSMDDKRSTNITIGNRNVLASNSTFASMHALKWADYIWTLVLKLPQSTALAMGGTLGFARANSFTFGWWKYLNCRAVCHCRLIFFPVILCLWKWIERLRVIPLWISWYFVFVLSWKISMIFAFFFNFKKQLKKNLQIVTD